jgi:hypothetical protein
MLSHWPKPPRALDAIVRAMRARADGDADALSHWLDEANARDVSNGFVRRYSGETYLQNAARLVRDGDLAAAERFLGFATKRLPGDPRLLGVRADLLEGRGDKAGAAELLRVLLKDAKGSVYLERRLKRLE